MSNTEPIPCVKLAAAGYEKLALVFDDAFNQAAHGKGKERHEDTPDFADQTTQKIMRLMQSSEGGTHQAIKKLIEARGLTPAAARKERLGAIVYIASVIIAEDAKAAGIAPLPANDNRLHGVVLHRGD